MAVSAHCMAVLSKLYSKELCMDFRAIRSRVMCSAWARMDEEHIPFRQAIREAWGDIRVECMPYAIRYNKTSLI